VSTLAQEAPRFIAWSRVFSPLVPENWRDDAWRALDLPGSWDGVSVDFWSSFHVGAPAPRVPLLLHAALGIDGGHAREDWMRVASHLGLAGSEHTLPPDHLAVAAEVLACALDADEDVLVRELCARYLRPWCEVACASFDAKTEPLGTVPLRFGEDVACVSGGAAA
jgi:hypothetical protein